MDLTSSKGLQFMRELRTQLEEGKLALPAFPDVAMRVHSVLKSPYVTVPKLVSVVSTEPVLTARLLKMANSASMASAGAPVKDIQSAISRLGFTMVRNAAMSVALEQMMVTRSMGRLKVMLRTLWQHSVQVASIAYVLARHTRIVPPDDALLAGLLHEVGQYFILQKADAYPDLFNPENSAMLEELLQSWHEMVGAEILRSWNLPAEVVHAVEEHERLIRSATKADLVDIVCVANLHANLKRGKGGKGWNMVSAFQRLELTPEQSIQLLSDAKDKISEVQKALM